MLRLLAFSLAAYAMMAANSGTTLGQNPADNANAIDANAQHYVLLAHYKEMVGIVRNYAGGMLELRVSYAYPVIVPPDPVPPAKANKNKKKDNKKKDKKDNCFDNSLQMYQCVQAHVEPEAVQAMSDCNDRTKIVTTYIDFDLPLTQDAIVRKLQSSKELDENGNPKDGPPSEEKDSPGYPAKRSDLTKGDAVKVYLVLPSAAVVADFKAPIGTKALTDRPYVRMVVIINDLPEMAPMPKKSS